MNAIESERVYGFEVYPKRDLTIVRGEGAYVWDEAGRRFIDCVAGVGVASIGHSHPALVEAVCRQAGRLVTCPGIFYNDVRAQLLAKLVSIAPSNLTRAFLCNSGTESVETAIKLARHATKRIKFVSAMRGFHGRTLGALSATHKYGDAYKPLLPGFQFVPLNNIARLTAAVDHETAAVILEVVQGEGGVRPAHAEFLHTARELCNRHGALLIIDEVQTGFCRTGRMFACDHHDLAPDLLCLAKGIAGGLPMGAVLIAEKITAEIGMHGSTFGGNPLACAAALASIQVMQTEELDQQARHKGAEFTAMLRARPSPRIRDIRHVGLMIGIELKEKAKPYLLALLDRGVLALPAGPTVIRLLPPLTIGDDQLRVVADSLGDVLSA